MQATIGIPIRGQGCTPLRVLTPVKHAMCRFRGGLLRAAARNVLQKPARAEKWLAQPN